MANLHFLQADAVEHAALPGVGGQGVGGGFGVLIYGGKKEVAATFTGNDRTCGSRKLFQCFLDIGVHDRIPAAHVSLTMRLNS